MAKRASEAGVVVPKRAKPGKAVVPATLGMPGTFTRVGWQLPANMPFEEWIEVGLYLARSRALSNGGLVIGGPTASTPMVSARRCSMKADRLRT